MFEYVQFHSPVGGKKKKITTIIYTVNSTRHENLLLLLLSQTILQESVCALIFLFHLRSRSSGFLVDRTVKAVAGRDPVIVMETQLTARDALLGAVAAHPVARPVGQSLAVGFGVPPAQGHVPLDVFLLALLAGIFPVARVAHPARVRRPDVVILDDELEVVASAFQGNQAPGGKQAEDLHDDVVRQEGHVLLRLQKLLDFKPGLQKVM